jgi:RHS repeat-associated protein
MRRLKREPSSVFPVPFGEGASSFSRFAGEGTRIRCATLGVIVIVFVLSPAPTHAVLTTTTTQYAYNADGALTAITRTTDEDSDTTYLTWDDFVPAVEDPTRGTVRIGNGTLDGYGPSPGVTSPTFQFDARDRLVGYSDDSVAESYGYYAEGTLASASSNGDALHFYFDKAENATVTNIHHLASDLWSAYLERVRYLSDGTEEVLLSPRKDTACRYTPADETLQSYAYDIFGAQASGDLPRQYDLHENPFQYTGEYRDPMWGGYYLRARWYHPDLPTFISRDPTDELNRYGYGGGNPVNMVDPGGTNFFHSLGKGLQGLNAALNRGVGGHFARFFLAPILGPLQIAADPKGFWEAVKHDKGGIDIFLAVGVTAEAFGGIADSALVLKGLAVSIQRRFLARAALDSALGVGQSVAAAGARGFKHFDWEAFSSGVEMTLGTITIWRGVGSLNIRSGYTLTGERAAGFAGRLLENENADTALIFRQRTKLPIPWMKVSPAQEWLGLGAYHERLIAVTKSDFYATDFVTIPEQGISREIRNFPGRPGASLRRLSGQEGKLEFVGRVQNFNNPGEGKDLFLGNPRMLRLRTGDNLIRQGQPAQINKYNVLTNNCHAHAFSILESLGLRRSLRSYAGF